MHRSHRVPRNLAGSASGHVYIFVARGSSERTRPCVLGSRWLHVCPKKGSASFEFPPNSALYCVCSTDRTNTICKTCEDNRATHVAQTKSRKRYIVGIWECEARMGRKHFGRKAPKHCKLACRRSFGEASWVLGVLYVLRCPLNRQVKVGGLAEFVQSFFGHVEALLIRPDRKWCQAKLS